MAEKRATFSLRRRTADGFSNCRRIRTDLSVPSRSTFFFSRRNARSTGSPFLSLISVNALTSSLGAGKNCDGAVPANLGTRRIYFGGVKSMYLTASLRGGRSLRLSLPRTPKLAASRCLHRLDGVTAGLVSGARRVSVRSDHGQESNWQRVSGQPGQPLRTGTVRAPCQSPLFNCGVQA